MVTASLILKLRSQCKQVLRQFKLLFFYHPTGLTRRSERSAFLAVLQHFFKKLAFFLGFVKSVTVLQYLQICDRAESGNSVSDHTKSPPPSPYD
ncbi:MAG: hypothetical protein J7647_30105 [Cyanobacteria bacterium SBLK]|nr:hypothetical protein [Cyanobacteria bacterium SBLK]